MSSGGKQQHQQQGRRQFSDKTAHQQQQLMLPPAATSDYWSGGATTATASEFELLAASGGRNLGAGERLVGVAASGPHPLDTAQDQDYYLDVANAADSMLPIAQAMTFQDHHHQTPVAHQHHHLNHHMNQQQQELLMHQLQQEQMMLAAAELEADYDDYAVPSDENGCRLDRSQVELVRLIGEGQKGFVFLGKLQSRDGSTIIDVAIKTLKYETEQLIERLMAEAATMKQLEHPHIIKFIGMCPETPALIAMELAQFGELKHYLKINRQLIKCSQLVLFTFQISTALSYLESKNYVHRDVAARNVLVCSHNCVKLADFGLSRNLQTLHATAQQQQHAAAAAPSIAGNLLLAPHGRSSHAADQSLYVAAPRGKLPVRWLAPESLVFRRFTSASDVWMFAVCAWELFHFGQLRPWPQLRNQQVLLAIESGQRPQKPPACPDRLYALMLKCWSYAPVQRPKFREIKQCIWSIYLNERTREQLDLERLEQVRQKYLMMARQQQQVAMMQHHNNQQQQQMLMSYSTPSNYSSAATTDNEQSTSPCSSAFNSMGRGSSATAAQQQQQQKRPAVQVQVQRPDAAHQNQQALQSQLSRFKQRQQQATPADFRPHVLQKQRSQGAIGLTTARQRQQEEEEAAERDQSCCRHSARAATDKRRVTRTRDDQAIELAKRSSGAAAAAAQQPYRPAFFGLNDDDEREDDDDGDDDDDEDSAVESPTMLTSQSGRPMRQLPFVGRVMSASPALTADGARSQSRMVSLEPAYEGLFVCGNQAGSSGGHAHFSSRPASRAGQEAMLRANLDLGGGGSSRTSPILTNVTTSPALTTNNSNPPTRPVSWRNSSELHAAAAAAASNQQRTVASKCKQPDQLSQMLQALRITPMKAKLKQPPEQSVRVLQRESSKSPAQSAAAPRRSDSGEKRQPLVPVRTIDNDQSDRVDEHTRQLMVHQRLLGRIRPSSIVSDPRARAPNGRQESSPTQAQQPQLAASSSKTTRQLMHQKSVEAVDHSLQILESLMSSEGGLQDRTNKTSTLPRKRAAR